MAPPLELPLEILGSGFVVEVPDEGWLAFVERLWAPFVTPAEEAGDGAYRLRVRPDEMWTWVLDAAGEVLGMGDDRWFLAAELRYWILARAVERAAGGILLHASLVARDGRAAVLVARSGGGKSTLSLHLAARGWGYRGDDLVFVEPESCTVVGLPTPVGMRDAARWPELSHLWEGVAVDPPQGAFMLPAAPLLSGPDHLLEVGAVTFLEFLAGGATATEPLSAAEAAVQCLSQSHVRDGAAIEVYARLCRGAARARLRYGSSAGAEEALAALMREGA